MCDDESWASTIFGIMISIVLCFVIVAIFYHCMRRKRLEEEEDMAGMRSTCGGGEVKASVWVGNQSGFNDRPADAVIYLHDRGDTQMVMM